MSKALELKEIERRFTFHELRAHYVMRCAVGPACESGDYGARLRSDKDRKAERYVIPNFGI